MQVLKLRLDQVEIPSYRQRQEVDGELLGELMESITAHGLLHPIVVRANGAGFILVAGFRRFQAVSNLSGLGESYKVGEETWPSDFIPAVLLGSLEPLAALEAEYEENVRRVDLTFRERALATAKLADIRRQRAQMDSLPLPNVGDIAREVRWGSDSKAREDTRREIILAPLLDAPHLKAAKTLDEAWKAHIRQEEQEKNRLLAAQVGDTFGKHSHTLVRADCFEWFKGSQGGWVDVILTDPPYGMGADGFGDAGGRLVSQVHEYGDSVDVWKRVILELGPQWYRVAKPQAHLYICCDIDGFHFARENLTSAGWWVHRTPLVNYKVDGSRVPWPEHGPQRKYEFILYAVKGKKNVTRIYPDVIETKGDDNLGHGAQKPVALYTNLLRRSVRPGDVVLDCFGGTGTILPACHELQCKATYVELDPTCYGIALKRLEALE